MKYNGNQKYVAEGRLILQLYVSGMSSRSMDAIDKIRHLCDENLDGAFDLEIIDLYKNPDAASEMQIVFSPSLIKTSPLPRKTLVGDFSDTDKVIKGLGLIIKE